MTAEEPTDPPVPSVLRRQADGVNISYKINQQLGKGGFGTVYAGEEFPAHKPIAIKCIPQSRIQQKRVREKLLSEVGIQKSLDHPNIVKFIGVFQDKDYVYILLELCSKGTVFDLFKKCHPMPEEETSRILFQILQGLVYLHGHNIIHRDLKLQNFLIDENDTVKIADFGLSAQIHNPDEKKMTVCGTPSYISPEVLGGKEAQTVQADIWSVGVCAFLLLTSKNPFQEQDRKVTYKRIQKVDYSWPQTPTLSDEAYSFVDSILQHDPTKRPRAIDLLHHPFILKYNHPPTNVSHSTLPQEYSLLLPSYAVRLWWDISSRYGLAYLLHNHVCGACFNDRSRILLFPDETIAQYWDTPQTDHPEIISMKNIEGSPVLKKLKLIKEFAHVMKTRAGQLPHPPLEINMPTDIIPHVKYWARTKDGILFRMANRDIQANFRDHTKLIIESSTRKLFFESSQGIKELTLDSLKVRSPDTHEERKRFAIVKEMAKYLV